MEEATAVDEDAQEQLGHENSKRRAVDYVKPVAEACDDRDRGFESERDAFATISVVIALSKRTLSMKTRTRSRRLGARSVLLEFTVPCPWIRR